MPSIGATMCSASRNDVLYFIRGQGATFGISPSIVTYFADVPQQTNAGSDGSNINFYDLEPSRFSKDFRARCIRSLDHRCRRARHAEKAIG